MDGLTAMRRTINDLVNDAIVRWVDMTGVDLSKKQFKIGDWEIRSLTEDLNESRLLDPTGLTTFMLLRGMTEWYLKEIAFTAYELILNPAESEKTLAPMRALRNVLEDPQVIEIVEDFQDMLRSAALEYGLPVEGIDEFEDLMNNRYGLAQVRRDALRSMDRLEAHQFTQGKGDLEPLKFNPEVYEFWNMNSLLLALRAQKVPGISLCLIRDPEESLFSFFVFAIRNGDTITILTDRSREPHPAYKRMSRRPDRELERRASRNWFPYSLLDIKASEDGKRLYANARTSLVPINVEGVPLKKIGQLHPEELVWLTLMFDLIRDRYWKKNHLLPELSYTGQMVVEPHALVGAHGALVKEGTYQPLQLAPLKAEDVTAEKTAPQWERAACGHNRWMTDRYVDKVPDALYNVVGEHSVDRLLASGEVSKDIIPMIGTGPFHEVMVPHVEVLSPLNFGSKDKIEKDRVWAARVNQMRVIRDLADEEFKREKDNILAWYKEALEKNADKLLDAAARGELLLPHWFERDYKDHSPFGCFRNNPRCVMENALRQGEGANFSNTPDFTSAVGPYYGDIRLGEWDFRDYKVYCYEREDTGATVFSLITPNCPDALAILCGVEVKDLPWALQNWYRNEPYTGNSILDRLDPEDWVLKNPWRKLHLRVLISSSKGAYHARRKALGLPRKIWEKKEGEKE